VRSPLMADIDTDGGDALNTAGVLCVALCHVNS
jgi:hypothetical protein